MAGNHSGNTGARSFRRAMTATLVLLGLACVVFAALGYLRGPQLSSAKVDVTAVTEKPAQQLRLFMNQTVATVDAKDVTVEPAVPFTIATDRDAITVQFDGRLANATDYSVRVKGITSPYENVTSTVDYSFATSGASFYYLDRADPTTGSDDQDQIVRAGVSDGSRESVVRATRIQDYVVVDGLVIVATLENNESSAITIVDPQSQATEKLRMPGTGTIDLLEGSSGAGMLGFTFSSLQSADGGVPEYLQTLFFVDLSGNHDVEPVLGLGGEPLDVLAWQFIPGTPRAVVQLIDQSVLAVDLSGSTPILPLGSYAEMGRISPDGASIVVGDIYGDYSLSIADRAKTPLPIAAVDGIVPYGGDLQLLAGGQARVQQVAIFNDVTGRFSSHIVYQKGDSSRTLYEKTDQKGSIETFEVSPNGQYLAVTTIPDVAASIIDGYFVDASSTSVSTILVDVATGTTLGSVNGFDVDW